MLRARPRDLDPVRELPYRPAAHHRCTRGRTDGSIRLRATTILKFSLAWEGASTDGTGAETTPAAPTATPPRGDYRDQALDLTRQKGEGETVSTGWLMGQFSGRGRRCCIRVPSRTSHSISSAHIATSRARSAATSPAASDTVGSLIAARSLPADRARSRHIALVAPRSRRASLFGRLMLDLAFHKPITRACARERRDR